MANPDFKRRPRIKDRALMKLMHQEGGSCVSCGTTSNLQLHHVRKRSRGGDDTRENLVFLCLTCHELLHRGDGTVAQAVENYQYLRKKIEQATWKPV